MAASNQVRFAPKVVKTPSWGPSASNQAQFTSPASGLTRVGIASGQALKSKRKSNLKLAGNN